MELVYQKIGEENMDSTSHPLLAYRIDGYLGNAEAMNWNTTWNCNQTYTNSIATAWKPHSTKRSLLVTNNILEDRMAQSNTHIHWQELLLIHYHLNIGEEKIWLPLLNSSAQISKLWTLTIMELKKKYNGYKLKNWLHKEL